MIIPVTAKKWFDTSGRSFNAIASSLLGAVASDADPQVQGEQRRTLLLRARVLCWIALVVVPFTILSFDAAFHRARWLEAVLLTAFAEAAVFILAFALEKGVFDKRPAVAYILLLGVICNVTEVLNLAITGGPTGSTFFFPYYLIYFGIATMFPGPLWAVIVMGLLLPVGYAALGLFSFRHLAFEPFVSNLMLLFDYAVITCFANRTVTSIFLREVKVRMDLEAANQRLRDLDRIKSEFFANLNHELRTPLTLILAPTASLLGNESGPLTQGQRTLVDAIFRNASRLLSLINDLLLLARLDSGQTASRHDPVAMDKIATRVVTAIEPYARSLGLRILGETETDLPPWYGDAGHLERILLNLLSNACKFSKTGGTIRLSVTHPRQGLVLSVADDGIGIAAQDIPRLFQRFVQVESAANRRYEGTGIGLAIVKELTELHGGRVEVDSQPGVGSCFRVLLPSRPDPEGQAPVEELASEPLPADILPLGWSARTERAPTPTPEASLAAPETAVGERRRIFVVEDNADLLQYLKQELGRHYRVLAFSDSRQAVESAAEDPPDLILSDVMMPVLDGLELVRRMRQEPRTENVPVLLLSAHDELETKVAGLEAGADDYIQKPFQLPEVRARIELHLRLRAQATALARKAQELSVALHDLTRAQATLVHSEKMAAIGRVVAGVAHEINNPLHFLKGNLAILKRRTHKALPEGTPSTISPLFADIDASTERILGITKDLLLFGRKDSQEPTAIAVQDVVTLAFKMLAAQVGPGVRMTHSMNVTFTVVASPQDLFQIILNLLQNAIHAVNADRGEVKVECEKTDDSFLEIRIIDNGCGMDPLIVPKIFDPFFTTKPPGQGTGLGLAIVQNLVIAQRGTIRVTSAPGQGTTFALRLPCGEAA